MQLQSQCATSMCTPERLLTYERCLTPFDAIHEAVRTMNTSVLESEDWSDAALRGAVRRFLHLLTTELALVEASVGVARVNTYLKSLRKLVDETLRSDETLATALERVAAEVDKAVPKAVVKAVPKAVAKAPRKAPAVAKKAGRKPSYKRMATKRVASVSPCDELEDSIKPFLEGDLCELFPM